MSKNLFKLVSLLVVPFAICSCGGGGGGGGNEFITVDPLNNLNIPEEYMPVKSKIKQQSGNITVAMVFQGDTKKGWQALADEYMRLHSNKVKVTINSSQTSEDAYKTQINSMINSGNIIWDIVQGNIVGNLPQNGYNMNSALSGKNYYAGNGRWDSVLDRIAYNSSSSSSSTDTYILNSENLNTAWFVNTDALKAAGDEGYRNLNGEVANPITWEDLMSLCSYMQEAGYESPLGISLNASSISATQFTWLLRVYGDYYYRDLYDTICKPYKDLETGLEIPYEVDLQEKQPEANSIWKVSYTRLLNTIFETNPKETTGMSDYNGAQSDRFYEFLEAMHEMKPYISVDATTKSFDDMRDMFSTQSSGKKSPQIMLDFLGSGIYFERYQNLKFDFFDYPYISEGDVIEGVALLHGDYPLVRDVGGNGGYISILNRGSSQNTLNMDFVKFVMSPYGQQIYYNKLEEVNANPQGQTTVKHVNIPQKWQKYFGDNEKTKFNGLVDDNPYLSWLIRYIGNGDKTKPKCSELWGNYMHNDLTTFAFAQAWDSALMDDWKSYASARGWSQDAYKNEHFDDIDDNYLQHGK